MKYIYLTLCLAHFGQALADKIAIEEVITSITSDAPELNLILRNLTDQPIEFLVRFGNTSDKETKCATNLMSYDHYMAFRKSQTVGYQSHHSYGFIPPNRWTHRSYRVGFYGDIPPCSIPYEVIYRQGGEEGRLENVVTLQKNYRFSHGYGNSTIDVALESETVIEELRGQSRKLIIARTVVRNTSKKGAYIFVSDRGIECKPGSNASFNLIDGVKQGEDVGPASITPEGWVVFKQSISFHDRNTLVGCSVWLQISTFDEVSNIHPLHKVEFNLDHDGMYLDSRTHHHKTSASAIRNSNK